MTRLKQVSSPENLEVSGLTIDPAELDHEQEEDPNRRMRADGILVEVLDDYSTRLTVPDSLHRGGLTIVFRDPTQLDLEFVAKESRGLVEKSAETTKRLACKLCTQWGDRPGVSIPVYDRIRAKLALAIMQEVNDFLTVAQ
jgi:hypothetical protein